jgi:hypothetical protein
MAESEKPTPEPAAAPPGEVGAPAEAPAAAAAPPPDAPPALIRPPAGATSDSQGADASAAAAAARSSADTGDLAEQRPELLVGGAFAGGMLLALVLKRLGR